MGKLIAVICFLSISLSAFADRPDEGFTNIGEALNEAGLKTFRCSLYMESGEIKEFEAMATDKPGALASCLNFVQTRFVQGKAITFNINPKGLSFPIKIRSVKLDEIL